MKIKELFADKIFTISNVLSITRVALVPFFGYSLYIEDATGNEDFIYFTLAIAIFMIMTDFLDGYIARMLHQVSRLGRFLDPISDKITINLSLLILHFYKDFPLWIILILILRDLYSVAGGYVILKRNDVQVAPNILGKLMVCSVGLSAIIYIISPDCILMGRSLREISVYLIVLFVVTSTILYWKTYSKVYFEDKS